MASPEINSNGTNLTGVMSGGSGTSVVSRLGLTSTFTGVFAPVSGSPAVNRIGMTSTLTGVFAPVSGSPAVNRTGMTGTFTGVMLATPGTPTHRISMPAVTWTGPMTIGMSRHAREVRPGAMVFAMKGALITRMSHSTVPNLTVHDAAREIYALWGMDVDPNNIEYKREAVVAAINAAVQLMHAQAHRLDYFNKQALSVTVTGGTSSVTLDKSVQIIRGPVRTTAGLTLRKIETRSEFDNFIAYYYGGSAPDGVRAYYIDSSNEAKGDNVAITLHVTPTPVADTPLTLEASLEGPRYTGNDIILQTELRLPAKHAESIFWPLIRHWAAGDTNFKNEELRPEIEAKYRGAMVTLGLLDPEPRLERKKEALPA